MKKRRAELGLTQTVAGTRIGVTASTVLNWETGKTEPTYPEYPGLIAFLGYDPSPEPATLPDRLRALCRRHGWSIREAARHFGVDPGTWGAWERGEIVQHRKHRERLASLLGVEGDALDTEMRRRWNQIHGTHNGKQSAR